MENEVPMNVSPYSQTNVLRLYGELSMYSEQMHYFRICSLLNAMLTLFIWSQNSMVGYQMKTGTEALPWLLQIWCPF